MYGQLLSTIILLNLVYFAGICVYELALLVRERVTA